MTASYSFLFPTWISHTMNDTLPTHSQLTLSRPIFDPVTNFKPQPFFWTTPTIVEKYREPQSCFDPARVRNSTAHAGCEYREGWIKWFSLEKGFGFLLIYDSEKSMPKDLYIHASERIELAVALDPSGKDYWISGDYIPKVASINSEGRHIMTTPCPVLEEGQKILYLHANNAQRGDYAARWFPESHLIRSREIAENNVAHAIKAIAVAPRFSLFVETLRQEEREKHPTGMDEDAWVSSGNHVNSELWYETNQYNKLKEEWNRIKPRLNWCWQRLVVIIETVNDDGGIGNEIVWSMEQMDEYVQRWRVK